jgi:hypothetical protein
MHIDLNLEELDGMEDIQETNTTDALADLLSAYCLANELPYQSADELLHEVFERIETLRGHTRWLLTFIDRWDVVQGEEDFEQTCAARGEA